VISTYKHSHSEKVTNLKENSYLHILFQMISTTISLRTILQLWITLYMWEILFHITIVFSSLETFQPEFSASFLSPSCPSDPPLFLILMIFGWDQIVCSSSLCSSVQLPVTSASVHWNIHVSALFSSIASLWSFLSVRDQASAYLFYDACSVTKTI
jgi:hypothetical protein